MPARAPIVMPRRRVVVTGLGIVSPVGNAVDELLLLCFHYDPATGKYSRNAMMFARAGGVTTVLALGGFIFVMFRKERLNQ